MRDLSSLTRRDVLGCALAAPLAAADSGVVRYIQSLARDDGGYAWEPDPGSHLTPTFAAIACYRLLGQEPPRKAALARFLREHYPLPEKRRQGERPLRRFDFEQIQALAWLGEDVSGFAALARAWSGPAPYLKAYEHEGHPVFQHEVMSLLCRPLVGLDAATPQWKAYVLSRRRPNGSFNSTPASEGGDGHVMNTWWGLEALKTLGEPAGGSDALAAWLEACQLPGGGFTWQPKPELAGVDDVAYTWAALRSLKALGVKPARAGQCAAWLHSLRNSGRRLRRPARPAVQSGGDVLCARFAGRPGRDAAAVAAETARGEAAAGRPEGVHHPDRSARRGQPAGSGRDWPARSVSISGAPRTPSPAGLRAASRSPACAKRRCCFAWATKSTAAISGSPAWEAPAIWPTCWRRPAPISARPWRTRPSPSRGKCSATSASGPCARRAAS